MISRNGREEIFTTKVQKFETYRTDSKRINVADPRKVFHTHTAYNNFSYSSCCHEYFQMEVQERRKRNKRRPIQEKRKTNNKTEEKKQIDGETNG